jgi:short-subunit dehydrogenase
MGVVHGLQAFLPSMKASREECHIVNTASMVGIVGSALSGPYAAAKFGIVGISEVLAAELDGTEIGVSVLCPSWVNTQMPHNGRNRPERFGGPFDLAGDVENAERNARYLAAAESGLNPSEVADMVLAAMAERRLYVFTHPEQRHDVDVHNARVAVGFDAAELWASLKAPAGADGGSA